MHMLFEKPVEDHDPDLYKADDTAKGVDGLESIDDRWLSRYDELGYLYVRNAIPRDMVEAALTELRDMAALVDPQCASVCYEGSLRTLIEEKVGGSLEEAEKEAIRTALESVDTDQRVGLIRKFHGLTKEHAPLKAVSSYRPLRAALEKTLKAPPRMFQSMALIKPPGGREKPWHQDHAYFDYPIEARICGVWIALQKVGPENGCMFALEGEHREGPRIHFKRRDWQICDTDVYGHRQVALPMEAGDLMIFDAKLPHGTPINRSDSHRWALQFHYHGAGLEKSDEELRLAVFGSEGKGVTC